MTVRGSNTRKRKKKKNNKKLTRIQYWKILAKDSHFHETHYPDKKAKRKRNH